MIDIHELVLTEEVLKGPGKFILAALSPVFVIDEASKEGTKRTGTTVEVALTAHQFKRVSVFVAEPVPCTLFDVNQVIEVTFQDFKGRIVLENGASVVKGEAQSFLTVAT